jgi:hypothetical protein
MKRKTLFFNQLFSLNVNDDDFLKLFKYKIQKTINKSVNNLYKKF